MNKKIVYFIVGLFTAFSTANAYDMKLSDLLSSTNQISSHTIQALYPKATLDTMVDFEKFIKNVKYIRCEWIIKNNNKNAEFLAFCEQAATTNKNIMVDMYGLCNNAWENFLEHLAETDPASAAVFRESKSTNVNKIKGIQNLANIFRYVVHRNSTHYLGSWKDAISKEYVRETKKWFVNRGESYVTKDGVNPLQPYVDDFTAAINAPKMTGFEECLSKIGLNVGLDRSKIPTDQEIQDLVYSIMIDDVQLSAWKAKLIVYLGVDGYNDMVSRYNGEKNDDEK